MISHLDSDEIKRVNLVSVECSKCKANLMGRGGLSVKVPCQRTGEAKMPWYELILSSEQLSEGISEKIQSDFEALFIKAETPPEMALFCDTFPVACCGVSERNTIKRNLFLTFRSSLQLAAGNFN